MANSNFSAHYFRDFRLFFVVRKKVRNFARDSTSQHKV